MTLKDLEKKVRQLEVQKKVPNLAIQAMDVLSDEELDVLQEYVEHRDAGFPSDEIQSKMGGRWQIVMDAEKALNKQYSELLMRKR